MKKANNLTLVSGSTEVLIAAGNARLIKIVPQAASTGTCAIYEDSVIGGGSTARFTITAADLTAGGKDFGAEGVQFQSGLTIKLSQAGDSVGVVWGPNA